MAHTGSHNGVSPVHHHPDFYLKDGNITFIVRHTYFMSRSLFECESQFFVKEFAKAPREGTSDSTAFRLDQVTIADFANFLWVWYSQSYRRERKPKEYWLTILELSTVWQFPEMKKLAIDELQSFDIEPVEKITTYDRYQIDRSLLLPAYKLLCKRAGRMSIEEGEQLKLHTVLGIQEARERAIRSAAESGCRSPTSADVGDEELDKILIDVFSLKGHNANRQGAQPQAKPDPVPTIKTPTPTPNVNGTNKSSASGSSSQNPKDNNKTTGSVCNPID
ncbi:hypothetical protein DFJ58DRAFT_795563 [Suillus subalutaceus]|uniref:uncharacterized protein n=1 Tax=Suillus subalutaceus TaxID=48586 RepID=UPI001B867C02|nr:uncharacterized protein DFJ58DRAFT_795563 [Suillus subalutaceus]KAG1848948.1 hypothetical protein DFJ58DRAFT_795563 [Suillus subalutaceus]